MAPYIIVLRSLFVFSCFIVSIPMVYNGAELLAQMSKAASFQEKRDYSGELEELFLRYHRMIDKDQQEFQIFKNDVTNLIESIEQKVKETGLSDKDRASLNKTLQLATTLLENLNQKFT